MVLRSFDTIFQLVEDGLLAPESGLSEVNNLLRHYGFTGLESPKEKQERLALAKASILELLQTYKNDISATGNASEAMREFIASQIAEYEKEAGQKAFTVDALAEATRMGLEQYQQERQKEAREEEIRRGYYDIAVSQELRQQEEYGLRRQENMISTASSLIEDGLDDETVAKTTGLPLETVVSIRQAKEMANQLDVIDETTRMLTPDVALLGKSLIEFFNKQPFIRAYLDDPFIERNLTKYEEEQAREILDRMSTGSATSADIEILMGMLAEGYKMGDKPYSGKADFDKLIGTINELQYALDRITPYVYLDKREVKDPATGKILTLYPYREWLRKNAIPVDILFPLEAEMPAMGEARTGGRRSLLPPPISRRPQSIPPRSEEVSNIISDTFRAMRQGNTENQCAAFVSRYLSLTDPRFSFLSTNNVDTFMRNVLKPGHREAGLYPVRQASLVRAGDIMVMWRSPGYTGNKTSKADHMGVLVWKNGELWVESNQQPRRFQDYLDEALNKKLTFFGQMGDISNGQPGIYVLRPVIYRIGA